MKFVGKTRFKAHYGAWFVILAAVIFYPFYKKGISLIWNIDGIGQYYPAFLYTGQWLRDFRKFDLKIALGENVISALNYYGLCDPLNILAIFANKSNGAYIFSAMIILRLYLSGLAFKKYCKYMSFDNMLSTGAALAYVFSGYGLCGGLMYIQFLAPLMYFPLILYGLEKAFKEHKFGVLVVSSLYAALSNIYFMYMVALYIAVYCIVRTFFIYGGNIKKMALSCLQCALSVLSGLVISLPLTLPFIKGLLKSKRGGVSVIHILSNPANWIPSLSKIRSYGEAFVPLKNYIILIPVAVYIIVIASLFMWRSRREKQCAAAVAAFLVMAALPVTYFILSGFDNAYNRWYFLMTFTFLVVFCANVERVVECVGGWCCLHNTRNSSNGVGDESSLHNIKNSDDIASTVENKIGINNIDNAADDRNSLHNIDGVFGTVNNIKVIIFLLCVINTAVAGVMLYSPAGIGFSNDFISFKSAKMYADSPVNYSDMIASDIGIYRISNDSLTNVNERPENVAMINGYNGLTFWLSVVNKNTQEIVNRLGTGEENLWRGYGLNNSVIFESLAGVKYYLHHDNENVPAEYKQIENIDFYGEKWELYENPDALPLIYAFTADYYESSLENDYYSENRAVLENVIPSQNINMDKSRISADIALPGDGYVLLCIPYSDGWRAYIDGEKAEVLESGILYCAVKAPAGNHNIVFEY